MVDNQNIDSGGLTPIFIGSGPNTLFAKGGKTPTQVG